MKSPSLARRCGDLYEDEAVTTFNCCAVSDKKCVPQAVTEDAYPVPQDAVLDSSFDLSNFQGRWYITAGYNKLFDTFDCQEHYFSSPRDEPNKVFGKIQWRIGKPDGDFIERDTVQRFVQVRAPVATPRGAGVSVRCAAAVVAVAAWNGRDPRQRSRSLYERADRGARRLPRGLPRGACGCKIFGVCGSQGAFPRAGPPEPREALQPRQPVPALRGRLVHRQVGT